MFGLGIPELIIIFVIALLVFGPKKLPDLGKSIGRAMAEFKRASDDFQESVKAEMKEVEKTADMEEVKKLGNADLSQTYSEETQKPESGQPEEHTPDKPATGETPGEVKNG